MDGLEAEYEGRAAVIRLNVEEPENAAIQRDYQMRGHPSVVILDESGAVTDRFFGAAPPEALRAALDAVVP